ncbi:hypothetical protein EDE15_4464 [Edaphobacter aggregans]|uniref:Parallel beta helix pectate lyase-like protein n=1 Tax=Edaphobacter aggregans TaxID=570835 RepID=A0A428MPQ8_9BACT|nr:hypothetical protein [Edaphobacter aggregans]RSL18859.1 hypothetical protein EDE15_4464 [Edaphobacter aggregans]
MKKLSSSICILLWLIGLLSPAAVAQMIQISNVEELYSAVNDPANTGASLVLAPGTYMLSATDSKGAARPNGGRIELQMDMSMVGVEGDRDSVVINASGLPLSSFPPTVNGVVTGPNAAVRMGLGHNALEWLTVRDAVNGGANIDTGLQAFDPGTAFIRVAHVATTGGARGLNILNFGPQTSGQTIEADIVDCYFFSNNIALAEGIRIGNFQGAQGSTVNVRMNGNLSWGQQMGRSIVNNRAQNSMISVISSGNRFYDNGFGTFVFGGLSANGTRADGNTIDFEAHGDQFLENTAASQFDHGGLIVVGAENDSPTAGGGSNNTVNVRLWGCRMSGNALHDLYGVGARSNFLANGDPSLSQDNHVTIEIKGAGNGNGRWQPVEQFADSLPGPPDYGNSVTVID